MLHRLFIFHKVLVSKQYDMEMDVVTRHSKLMEIYKKIVKNRCVDNGIRIQNLTILDVLN